MKEFSRRDLLKGAIAASAATMASGTVLAGTGHQHHDHINSNTALIDTSMDCLKKGQACLDHCFELLKKGDNSIAECADKVNEMLVMCTALSQMASYQSKHLKELAKVCVAACKDCKKECDKHDKHAECKACSDSCADCIKACEKIAA